jgi:hypothetical protein
MSGKSKLLASAKKKDELAQAQKFAQAQPKLMYGVSAAVPKNIDEAKIGDLMDKSKKPAEWYATVVGYKFIVDIRVGSTKTELLSFDLGATKDVKERRNGIDILVKDGLMTAAERIEFNRKYPDPDHLKGLLRIIESKKAAVKQTQDKLKEELNELERWKKIYIDDGGK